MSPFLYQAVPFISAVLFLLMFQWKIWKRSISSFVAVSGLMLISNLMHFGYIDMGFIFILLTIVLLLLRAMTKPENDKLIYSSYQGKERRGKHGKV